MGNVFLKKVKSVKYLGVMLDENVTWDEQIKYLSTKLSRSAGIFSKLRYYLKTEVLIRVYHALFNSHLQYGILCWGNTTDTNLERIQVLQNKSIKNMFKAPRYYRLDNYYLNYRILKVRDLYELEVAKFMHSHYNENVPHCFLSFFNFARNSDTRMTPRFDDNSYSVPLFRTVRGDRSIKYFGPVTWNKLPVVFQDLSKQTFKNAARIIFLQCTKSLSLYICVFIYIYIYIYRY